MDNLQITQPINGVCEIQLQRPECANAFDDHLIQTLTTELQAIDRDPTVRIVILRGAGNHFCAGADLQWMQRMANYSETENYQDAWQLAELMHTLATLSKATLALVHGASFGGGVGLIACCDIAIARADAVFCLSEVKMGLIPAVISPYVINTIGSRAAQRYFLSAEKFSASTAQKLGLIHEIAPDNDLMASATPLIEHLLQNSPAAIAAAKQLIMATQRGPIDQTMREDTSRRIARIRVSAEGQEGLQAFLAKRPPRWLNSSEQEE